MKPSTDIVVYFDVEINNDIINKLFAIPGIGYIASFLISRLLQLQNFGFAIAGYVLKLLGIRDFYVVRVEKISDSPLIFRFYYRSDPNPILIVIIVGIIGATIASWVMWSAIRDIGVATITYKTQEVITQRYIHYTNLINEVIDFCKTQPDPSKCFNNITTTITAPETGTDEAKNTQDSLTATIETLKQFLILAVVVAVVVGVVSYLRR
jgi:large-conductance mechanosensitive channel